MLENVAVAAARRTLPIIGSVADARRTLPSVGTIVVADARRTLPIIGKVFVAAVNRPARASQSYTIRDYKRRRTAELPPHHVAAKRHGAELNREKRLALPQQPDLYLEPKWLRYQTCL